jgi:hypothetical protein
MMMNPLGLMLGAKSLEWSYYKIPRNQTLNNRIAFAALFSSSVKPWYISAGRTSISPGVKVPVDTRNPSTALTCSEHDSVNTLLLNIV